MYKTILEVAAVLVALGKILDYYFKDEKVEKSRIAYRFLEMEDWLRTSPWGEIQKFLIDRFLSMHCRIFGSRIFSLRYPLTLIGVSLFLTSMALFISLFIIPESELLRAGFNDPETGYFETVQEFYIETADKTQSLIPSFLVNIVFDFLAVTFSFVIVRSLARSGGTLRLFLLMSLDIFLSLVFIAAIQLAMVIFQYSGYMLNIIADRPTTFLLTSSTSLTLVSCTVALPVIVYSLALLLTGFIRFGFKAVAFFTNRLADESSTVFTDAATFLASIIIFFSSLIKAGSMLIWFSVYLVKTYANDGIMLIIFKYWSFWLRFADIGGAIPDLN